MTDDDLTMFGRGACWALAQAVHDLTGWPMRAFWRRGGCGGHAFTEMPDGRYLDIRGAHDPADLLSFWSQRAEDVVPVTSTGSWSLPNWFNFRRWGRAACLARARQIAPELIAAAVAAEQETAHARTNRPGPRTDRRPS